MENKSANLINHQPKFLGNDLNFTTTNLVNVVDPSQREYINDYKLFIAHFNSVPNSVNELGINSKNAMEWFAYTYQSEIKTLYYNEYHISNKRMGIDCIYYFLYEDLIVGFENDSSFVRLLYRKTDFGKIEKIIAGLRIFKKRRSSLGSQILLLVHSRSGLSTKPLTISKPKLSIEDNYNEDFLETHQTILKRLSKKNDKGLVLLHGKPGTGKTNYIRYLICLLKKNVIFLPPNLATSITSPDLISILIENPNSILVIEDAENIVVDREINGNSPVSALLNISDGLLSDCLNIQVICSFNTDISKIDSALMRKGRLIAKYEFKELEPESANKLSQKLGFTSYLDSPMPLASIYNQNERDFGNMKIKKRIGFKTIRAN